MGDMAWDQNQTATVPANFTAGGGLQNLPGSVAPRKHKLNRSNIEREENDKMAEVRAARIHYDFPAMYHKPGGLWKEVKNREEADAAEEKGWYADIRDVPGLEAAETPERISQMTVTQAEAFVAAHAQDAAKLAEIEADETSHGNRAAVLALIEEAKDNFGGPVKKAPKAAAPAKAKAKK